MESTSSWDGNLAIFIVKMCVATQFEETQNQVKKLRINMSLQMKSSIVEELGQRDGVVRGGPGGTQGK